MSQNNNYNAIYTEGDIEKLVNKAKKGDSSAFEKLYHAFLTPVYRYVFLRTKDKDTTEDIVQTVFIKWYNALPHYTLDKSPLQYLFVIARRTLIDASRKKETFSLEVEEEMYEVPDDEPLLTEKLDIHITTDKILKEMESLKDIEQEILHLHFFSELSTQEIAEILDLKEPNIRQIKKRAIDKLHKKVSHLHDNT